MGTHRQLNPSLFGDEERTEIGEYGGEYGGGGSEYGGSSGTRISNNKEEQWKRKHMATSQEREQRNSTGRDSRSSEIERRRERSRSKERGRRSRSRERRRRSKSRDKRRKSRSRSSGRDERYNPYEPTFSP